MANDHDISSTLLTATAVAAAPPVIVNGAIDGPDLDLAQQVQQLLLPKSSPQCT